MPLQATAMGLPDTMADAVGLLRRPLPPDELIEIARQAQSPRRAGAGAQVRMSDHQTSESAGPPDAVSPCGNATGPVIHVG